MYNKMDNKMDNETIALIINKLKEEIKLLKSEISYDFVKFKYNMFEYYSNLQMEYLNESQNYSSDSEKGENYMRIVKYLSCKCIELDCNKDLTKFRKIKTNKKMIKTLKK